MDLTLKSDDISNRSVPEPALTFIFTLCLSSLKEEKKRKRLFN